MFLIRHPFLVLFTVVLLESMLLAKVGSAIGWGMTIGLILLSTMVGSMMMRQQGFQTFRRLQLAMARGENPGSEILEGVMIMAGGLLLMTPGFVSDAIGFVLLIPFTRKALVSLIARRLADLPLAANVVQDQWTYGYRPGQAYRPGQHRGEVYEGERVDAPVTRPVADEERVDIVITARMTQGNESKESPGASNVIEGEFLRKED